jgi:hypothetical protein
VTTQRGDDPRTTVPEDQTWFTHPVPRTPGDDAVSPGTWAGAPRAESGRAGGARAEGGWAAPEGGAGPAGGAPDGWAGPEGAADAWAAPEGGGRAERRRAREASEQAAAEGDTGRLDAVRIDEDRIGADGVVPQPRRGRRRATADSAADSADGAARADGFDPGDTGTWRVRDMVPGADGGRRNTTILRYLLGLLAIDHVRALSRWTFVVPIVGLVLLVVRPRWIGLAVFVLGVLLIVARIVAVRLIARRTLPRRYRPVEDDLRAAVEAGKANLRGELRRVGMPSSALALPRSVFRLGSSDSRRTARSRLRDIEIDRVLPRAQLDRALRVLDGASAGR